MKFIFKYILFLFVITIGSGPAVYAQGETIEELRKKTDQLFDDEEYAKAIKDYGIIISDRERSGDLDLNYRFGTCLLYGSGEQKLLAIGYLKKAVKDPSINKRAYYFLGKAYQLNFQFDDALKYYQKFKNEASTSEQKKYNIDVQIKACNNGKKLLTNITDMIVIQKTDIKAEDFYELYKMDNIDGSILVYDKFQSKYDKKWHFYFQLQGR